LNKKKIVFLTGTRADFSKLKSLISISQRSKEYEVHLFVTGMHMNPLYGKTIDEIEKYGFKNIYPFVNHEGIDSMDMTLAKTIEGFSRFVVKVKPELIVVHGDRVEAMAGAITGSLNNILVAHIEGGEISGTIDELIRHSISKMSHIHLVANQKAKSRLTQLGELPSSIFILGSPDLDLMNPKNLPKLSTAKEYYDINFKNYAIAIFHPVTTEFVNIKKDVKQFVNALIESDNNYIIIYPNNDLGSLEIFHEYKRLEGNPKIKLFPSLRFEYFLTFLQNSNFIIGNSSAGIREAPYYGTPTVNIGSRQNNRSQNPSIFNTNNNCQSILATINLIKDYKNVDHGHTSEFGKGDSDQIFLKLLNKGEIWNIDCQKQFQEI
jgi:UDP-N-acetylglucosamine 2-epimerase (hydrolysing)